MSVEILNRLNGEIWISIDGEITDIEEIASDKSISCLVIRNISDSRKLKEFLSRIPLNTVKKLKFISCSLEALGEEWFGQLQSVEDIEITQSIGKSYNELLRRIPNKSKVKNIDLENDKESGNDLDVTLLEGFKGLESIGLTNISGLDMQELQVVLCGARDLRQFTFEGDIQSLDFISGIDIEHINIRDENLKFGLITPDIARAHKNICFDTGRETGVISINSIEDGQGYELSMSSKYIDQIDEIRSLVNNAGNVKIYEQDKTEIHIDNKEKLKSLIEYQHILKDLPNISIIVPHMGVITPEQLKELQDHIEIKNIAVIDTEYTDNLEMYQYNIEQYEILHSKVQEIVGDIPEEFTDLQKFMIIYQRLIPRMVYDHKLIEEEEKQKDVLAYVSEYAKENSDKARNLFNGLIKGKCVCAGYADILYNCLWAVGIENYKIAGEVLDEEGKPAGHAWNKVKIDGVWYNIDLTNSSLEDLELCLRSDAIFEDKNFKQRRGRNIECTTDYPRKEVIKAFKFAKKFNDRVLDAEETSFFDRLKAKAMILLGKRKMIAEPEQESEGMTTREQQRRWIETNFRTGETSNGSQEVTTGNLRDSGKIVPVDKDHDD